MSGATVQVRGFIGLVKCGLGVRRVTKGILRYRRRRVQSRDHLQDMFPEVLFCLGRRRLRGVRKSREIVLKGPDGQPCEFGRDGLDNLRGRLETLFEHFTAKLDVIVIEIRVQGDVAYDYGWIR
jgi:hypothetical protein